MIQNLSKPMLGLTLIAGMTAVGFAHAAEALKYDRVSFVVSADKEVENDVLKATLSAGEQGQDTTQLSNKVNQTISWAMNIAKQTPDVDVRTLGYMTNPQYRDGRVDGWQVKQSISLKSKDSKALSALLGQLQEKLRVDAINYNVSPEVRKKTEEELIADALANFKQRAEQVRTNMGFGGYRLVDLDIQTASDVQPPIAYAANSSRVQFSKSAAPPALQAGKQSIRVSVRAEIELMQ